jgi:mannosyltransferase PIG-V
MVQHQVGSRDLTVEAAHRRDLPPSRDVCYGGGQMRAALVGRQVGRAADRWWSRVTASTSLRVVATPFLVSKLLVGLVVVLTVYSHSNTPGFPSIDELLQPFGNWDAQHYLDIAQQGYPAGPLDLTPGHPGILWAFFPGYPALVQLALHAVSNRIAAGMAVSAVCELVALLFLARLVMHERDRESASLAAWLLVLFPYAVFLSAAYSESAFLAAAIASLYYARTRRPHAASAAAGLAILVRITGLALIPVLLIELRGLRGRKLAEGLAAALLIPAAAIGYIVLSTWLRSGDALAYMHAQNSPSFGDHSLAWPWNGAYSTYRLATGLSSSNYDYLFFVQLVLGTAGAVAVVALWLSPRIPRSLSAYATAVWLLAVCLDYWQSVARYEIALIPLVLLASDLTAGRPERRNALLVASAVLMAYNTSVFATGAFVS